MATIHKLKKDGVTIFPATITDAVVHPSVGKTVTDMIKEYNVSELFPTEGVDGGNTYTLALAVSVLGSHLRAAEKSGGIKLTFIPNGQVGTIFTATYIKTKQAWSSTLTDWNEQVTIGPEIADPSGTWDYSTAQAYIDSKVTQQDQVITQLQQDINDSARIGDDDGTSVVANFSPQVDTVWNKQQTLTTAQKDNVMGNVGNRTAGNGLGCVILRADQSFESQVTQTNTIYVIHYDYTLTANFTIPTGSILDFQGGSLDKDLFTVTVPDSCIIIDPRHSVGTTANRPTIVSTGFQYFDTTLGKPIYWGGSAWIDATGATPV